jgi:glycosyltransferase involved in cell wall biosynthesis
MNVIHLAPLWFPVAADAAGGRETLLAGLVSALNRLGCHNTLLATGNSRAEAELVAVVERDLFALMQMKQAFDYNFYEMHQLALLLARARDGHLVHSHIGERAFFLSAVPGLGRRVLHTYHTPVWEDLEWFVRQHPDYWYSTVSEFQARRFRAQGATRCHVVPNGLDLARFTFHAQPGQGLAFLGRLEPSKGPDLAIRVAQELQRPLDLAGPITDDSFFQAAIKPHLNDRIRYIGTINHEQRQRLLGHAGCAVLPFRGAESFGLVSIEAMACGTPVVALANGALPEIVEPGVTGFLTGNENELAELTSRALQLDRDAVRHRVAARFDIHVVAAQYLELYRRIIASA